MREYSANSCVCRDCGKVFVRKGWASDKCPQCKGQNFSFYDLMPGLTNEQSAQRIASRYNKVAH